MATVEIDENRQQKAHEYHKLQRRLSLLNLALVALGIIFVFLFLDTTLRNWLQFLSWQPIHGWFSLKVAAYLVILMVGYEIITFPLSYYQGFILSHRYGLSTMTLGAWLIDKLKGFALGLVLEVV